MADIKIIEQGNVINITEPHFLISYSDEYGCDNWKPIAVLSLHQKINNMRLNLLSNGIDGTIIDMMNKELNFYLFELKNPSPQDYLIYHCGSMSNIWTKIHFTHVSSINKTNLLYYIKTKSKLDGIFFNSFIKDIQENYLEVIVKQLFEEALYKSNPDEVENYNKVLNYFYRLIFIVMPKQGGFTINDKFTLVEFTQYISTLSIKEFSYILNYLNYTGLKNKDIMRLLKFYHINQTQHQK